MRTPVVRFEPEGEPRGGVVLVPEVSGLDAVLRRCADDLVGEGFVVVVPDLWWRRGAPPTSTPDEIAAAVDALVDGEVLSDVASARDSLGTLRPRFLVGFCTGGLYARMSACAMPGWAGVVEFYGRIVYPGVSEARPVQPLDLLQGLGCAYLGHFGDKDPVAPIHHIAELQRRLGFVARPTQVLVYPGCGHAFMNPARPGHNAEAAALAWQRSLRFLDNLAG